MTKRFRLGSAAGLFLALTMCVGSAAARDIDERRWILMESENFSIYSSVNRRRTEELLLHLETLRAVFVSYLGFGANTEEKPTRILVVGRQSDYRDLGMSMTTVGQFRTDLRANTIIIRNAASSDENQVVLHEYVHFLTRVTDSFPFPMWWDEGFAEFASATRLTNSTFDVGMPLEGWLYSLNATGWLSWEDVIAARSYGEFDRNGLSAFYAQAWLLVHYLQTRPSDVHLNQRWADYAGALSSGANQVEAFVQAFGMSMDEVERRIEQYASAGRFQYWRIPKEAIEIDFEPTHDTVSRGEIQVQLGQFLFSGGDNEAALDWFEKAIENRPDDPAAHSGRARVLARLESYEEARAGFERALELDPVNPMTLLDYGIFEADNASRDDAPLSEREYLDAAEGLLTQARSITDGSVEIDTYLAWVRMRRDGISTSSIQLLESVVQRSPSDLWPAIMLASALAGNGRTDEALDLANAIIRYDHGRTNYSQRAQQIIDRIDVSISGKEPPSTSDSAPEAQTEGD